MKSKASLTLMEQTTMILVFTLASALCLKAFVWADVTSRHHAAWDEAVLHAQNAAEILKSQQGDYAACASLGGGTSNQAGWVVFYDENWQETTRPATYRLIVSPTNSSSEFLGSASVKVIQEEDGKALALLPVAWQEPLDKTPQSDATHDNDQF